MIDKIHIRMLPDYSLNSWQIIVRDIIVFISFVYKIIKLVFFDMDRQLLTQVQHIQRHPSERAQKKPGIYSNPFNYFDHSPRSLLYIFSN